MKTNLSTLLKEFIRDKINHSTTGFLFSEFMHACLYTPELGYYTSNQPILGAEGDFITAPELSPLFGYTIAKQIQDIYQHDYALLEFGAGTGKLARDVLLHLQTLNALPDCYYIIEVSAYLRDRQQQTLQTYPELLERCQWLTSWPQSPITKGIVLANEVLDAMPVELFRKNQNMIERGFVEFNNDNFYCTWQKANQDFIEHLPDVSELKNGYQSEVNLAIGPWLKEIFHFLTEGAVLLFDYGFGAKHYYHAERDSGTLMCHYQHKTHPNPFIHIGEQDITAHVNFTAVAEAAFKLGFTINGYTTQAAFLISNGIIEFLNHITNDAEHVKASQAIQKLTMPHEMGELFKCMALTKSIDDPLKGFSLMDHLHQL